MEENKDNLQEGDDNEDEFDDFIEAPTTNINQHIEEEKKEIIKHEINLDDLLGGYDNFQKADSHIKLEPPPRVSIV